MSKISYLCIYEIGSRDLKDASAQTYFSATIYVLNAHQAAYHIAIKPNSDD